MTLCRIMQLAYIYGDVDRLDDGGELWTDENLRFGIEYAEALINEGYVTEPMMHFSLAGFVRWCKQQLGERP